MDGLARPIGAGTTIEFDGNVLPIPKWTVRDFGTVENHVLRLRRSELIQLVRDVYANDPPEVLAAEIQKAKQEAFAIRAASPADVQSFMDSRHGLAFTLWILLERQAETRGKYDLPRIEEIILNSTQETFEDLLAGRDQAAGTDLAGNSTSPIGAALAGDEEGSRQPGSS